MKWNISTIVILITMALGGILFFALFKPVQVPDVGWDKSYRYDVPEPYGATVFYDVLQDIYGPDRVVLLKDGDLRALQGRGKYGYIVMTDWLSYNYIDPDDIQEMILEGHEVMLIAGSFEDEMDTIFTYPWITSFMMDSIVTLRHHTSDSLYRFSHYEYDFDSLTSYYTSMMIHLDSIDQSDHVTIDTLITRGDSSLIFGRWKTDSTSWYVHVMPELFSNLALKQKPVQELMTATFPIWEVDTVFLDCDLYHTEQTRSDTPLQYIIDQPKLKAAYLTMVIGLIAYLYFRGKRKQRIIPIFHPPKNTSIQYIQTLAQLYESQNQPDKLTKHLSLYFHHFVKRKYFLSLYDDEAIVRLSKKSQIEESRIRSILQRLDRAHDNQRFDHVQLEKLYTELESFYQACK